MDESNAHELAPLELPTLQEDADKLTASKRFGLPSLRGAAKLARCSAQVERASSCATQPVPLWAAVAALLAVIVVLQGALQPPGHEPLSTKLVAIAPTASAEAESEPCGWGDEVPGKSTGQAAKTPGLIVCTLIHTVRPSMLWEWIVFHRAQGVSSFVIYQDIGSDNNSVALLQPFLDAGVVELVSVKVDLAQRYHQRRSDSPLGLNITAMDQLLHQCLNGSRPTVHSQLNCQKAAFADCLAAHAHLGNTTWIGIFDVDEYFFVPLKPTHWPIAVRPSLQKLGGQTATAPWCMRAVPYTLTLLGRLNERNPDTSQVLFIGGVIGSSGHQYANWTGYLITTHTRTAPQRWIEGGPSIVGVNGCGDEDKDCRGMASAHKSIVRAGYALPEAAFVHSQTLRLGRTEHVYHDMGWARMLHYQYLSEEEVLGKAKANGNQYLLKALDAGPKHYLNMADNTTAAAFASLYEVCGDPVMLFSPVCFPRATSSAKGIVSQPSHQENASRANCSCPPGAYRIRISR